jgi:hypothetical protein
VLCANGYQTAEERQNFIAFLWPSMKLSRLMCHLGQQTATNRFAFMPAGERGKTVRAAFRHGFPYEKSIIPLRNRAKMNLSRQPNRLYNNFAVLGHASAAVFFYAATPQCVWH